MRSTHPVSRTQRLRLSVLPLATALSITIATAPAFADPGDINSVNTGPVVQGGEYYNTVGNQTTFIGSNGGLWIQSGTQVRGLEVDAASQLTGNGGHLHFSAPGGVIRVDGEVNVSGLLGKGFATANGGQVTMDAAYLMQNGRVYADGGNGGTIIFNVGAATFSPGSETMARGIGGSGGVIQVNASGVVDIQDNRTDFPNTAAILDASGHYLGYVNTNLIAIEGSVVNVDAVVRANGYVVADNGIVTLYNEAIAGPAGSTSPVQVTETPDLGTLMTSGSRGGNIQISSTGASSGCLVECALNKAASYNNVTEGGGIFTEQEVLEILTGNNYHPGLKYYMNNYDGDIVIGTHGKLLANGADVRLLDLPDNEFNREGYYVDWGYGVGDTHQTSFEDGFFGAGDGGNILLNAKRDVHVLNDGVSGGLLSARGGNGTGYVDKDSYTTTSIVNNPLWRPFFPFNLLPRTITVPHTEIVNNYTLFDGGHGGLISVNATRDINFGGSAHAFGGNGYQNYRDTNFFENIWLGLSGDSLPSGYVFDNQDNALGGLGGNGGLIAFSYGGQFNNTVVDALNGFAYDFPYVIPNDKLFYNYSQIDASGGHAGSHAEERLSSGGSTNGFGGLVVFSGESNPGDLTNVSVYRGLGGDADSNHNPDRFGTVVLPDATDATAIAQLQSGNTNFKSPATQLTIDQLRSDEILFQQGTLLLLSRSTHNTLSKKFNEAIVRTADPAYQLGGGGVFVSQQPIKNLLVASHVGNELILNKPNKLEKGAYDLGPFSDLNMLMVLNSAQEGDSTLINNRTWTLGDANEDQAGGIIRLISDGNIFNYGNLNTRGVHSAGVISLTSKQSIYNSGNINASNGLVGGSIVLKANRNLVNDAFDWGHILITDSEENVVDEFDDLVDGGIIRANGKLDGGRISGFAGNNIINLGIIQANATKTNSNNLVGGTLQTFAGNNNINFGLMEANAATFANNIPRRLADNYNSIGGYVRLHGTNLAANVDVSTLVDRELYSEFIPLGPVGDGGFNSFAYVSMFGPGQINATGGTQGGSVYLTSGESCGFGCMPNENPTHGTDGLNPELDDLLNLALGGPSVQIDGFSTKQNTPPLTVMDPFVTSGIPGSALNLGHIDTRSKFTNNGGLTWLVGNGQAGMGDGSSINGVNVNYAAIMGAPVPADAFQALLQDMNAGGNTVNLLAGSLGDQTALEAVMCDDITQNPELPEGEGVSFPRNFTLAANVTPPNDPTNVDLNALFQEYRFQLNNEPPQPNNVLILAFERPGLFLAQAYQPVTEEILSLALKEYNNALAQPGGTPQRAQQLAQIYLEQAGIDAETAQALLDQIQAGTVSASDTIIKVLQAMATQPEAPSDSTSQDTLLQ